MSSVALASPADRPPVAVASHLLGALSVSASSVFSLLGGLRGFDDLDAFALVPAVREGLFWLQSLQDPTCTFLLGDPFAVAPDFAVDLADTDRAQLQLSDPSGALVLCIITLPSGLVPGEAATMNLRGPVVFNTAHNLARQLVASADAFDFRAPVTIDAWPRRADGGIAPAAT